MLQVPDHRVWCHHAGDVTTAVEHSVILLQRCHHTLLLSACWPGNKVPSSRIYQESRKGFWPHHKCYINYPNHCCRTMNPPAALGPQLLVQQYGVTPLTTMTGHECDRYPSEAKPVNPNICCGAVWPGSECWCAADTSQTLPGISSALCHWYQRYWSVSFFRITFGKH